MNMEGSQMSREQLGPTGIEGLCTIRQIKGNVDVNEHIPTATGGDSNKITLLLMELTN
jgi:hypothetical protein